MKTFEEVRANTYEYYTYALLNAREELELGQSMFSEEEIQNKQDMISNYQKCLENIDEVTKMMIGKVTNELIAVFDHAMDTINPYGSPSIRDNYLNKGIFKSEKAIDLCDYLGIEPVDLEILKSNKLPGDNFRAQVNMHFGTNIPNQDFENPIYSAFTEYRENIHTDEKYAAKSFIRYMELSRDAGNLIEKNGKVRFLEDNQHYQRAKKTCSGKSI